jgi:hypothetical protein
MQREALKFWVYGLAGSIVLSVYELLFVSFSDGREDRDEKEEKNKNSVGTSEIERRRRTTGNEKGLSVKRNQAMAQLVMDFCDILIPVSAVGWVDLSFDVSSLLDLLFVKSRQRKGSVGQIIVPSSLVTGFSGGVSALVSLKGMWRDIRLERLAGLQ